MKKTTRRTNNQDRGSRGKGKPTPGGFTGERIRGKVTKHAPRCSIAREEKKLAVERKYLMRGCLTENEGTYGPGQAPSSHSNPFFLFS